MLVGNRAISEALGSKRKAYLNELRKRHGDEFPARKNSSGRWTADEATLRTWAIKEGYLTPETSEDLEVFKDREAAAAKIKKAADAAAPRVETLEDLFDFEGYEDLALDVPGLEGEIAKTRRLSALFARVVFSFKVDNLLDLGRAKFFKDFASELTNQIKATGALEKELTRQRIREGKLLDETSLADLASSYSEAVNDAMRGLGQAFLDLASENLAKTAEAAGIDLSLDSDMLLKLFEHKTRAARQRIADRLEAQAVAVAKAQASRVEEEDARR